MTFFEFLKSLFTRRTYHRGLTLKDIERLNSRIIKKVGHKEWDITPFLSEDGGGKRSVRFLVYRMNKATILVRDETYVKNTPIVADDMVYIYDGLISQFHDFRKHSTFIKREINKYR